MTEAPTASPWEMQRFEIRTRLEPLDYLHFMKSVHWTWPERLVAMLPAVGMGSIGAVAALIASEPLIERLPVFTYWDWGLAAALGGALVAYLIFKVFIIGPYIDSTFEGQPIGMGETTIMVDTQGVNANLAGIEMRAPWIKVQRVIVTDEHLFLAFSRLSAMIIPRRAFADDADAARFAAFVHKMAPKDT